jgi:hypothetical protein
MTVYRTTTIQRDGNTLTLVLVPPAWAYKRAGEKFHGLIALARSAILAGIAGEVAAVWITQDRVESYGPCWASTYLDTLTPAFVRATCNRTLTCT